VKKGQKMGFFCDFSTFWRKCVVFFELKGWITIEKIIFLLIKQFWKEGEEVWSNFFRPKNHFAI
jgi:hypothetical protein